MTGTLTAYRGLLGSYPNFMFNVPLEQIESFTADLHAVHTRVRQSGTDPNLSPKTFLYYHVNCGLSPITSTGWFACGTGYDME